MGYFVISKTVFDIHYVNPKAKVVVVGISPGTSQRFNKNYEKDRDAKYNNQKCAFSSSKNNVIRYNLIRMLNSIQINKYLGISCCSSLWEKNFDLVNFTSLLPHSVLKSKENKNKIINNDHIIKDERFISSITYSVIKNNDILFKEFNLFLYDLKSYQNDTIFIACGPCVYDILINHTSIKKENIIPIPHPSGANNGRVKIYCSQFIEKGKENTANQNALRMRKEAEKIINIFNRKKHYEQHN